MAPIRLALIGLSQSAKTSWARLGRLQQLQDICLAPDFCTAKVTYHICSLNVEENATKSKHCSTRAWKPQRKQSSSTSFPKIQKPTAHLNHWLQTQRSTSSFVPLASMSTMIRSSLQLRLAKQYSSSGLWRRMQAVLENCIIWPSTLDLGLSLDCKLGLLRLY